MAIQNDTSTEILESLKPVFGESKIEKFWKNFLAYQASYLERVDTLRTHAREKPVHEDGDVIMPKLLLKWTGGKTAHQPATNYCEKMSCSFPSSRIDEFDKLSKAFPSYLKMKAHAVAVSIPKLLVHEIAYLKSWDVEWIQEPTALSGVCLALFTCYSESLAFEAFAF